MQLSLHCLGCLSLYFKKKHWNRFRENSKIRHFVISSHLFYWHANHISLQIHSIFSLKKFVQLWQPNLFQIPIQTLKQAKLFMIEEYNSCHSKLASDDMDELTHMTAISIQKSYFWILICQLCSSQLDVPLCPFWANR